MTGTVTRPPARKGYAGTMVLIREGMEAKLTAPKIEAPDTMDYEGRIQWIMRAGY